MKTLLLLFLVLSSFSFYGQSYTEKYNSVYERYEYYNSKNELVGYKKYDPLYEEWKYTDLTQQRQERKSPYANLKVMDPFNEQLAYKVLASKQARYDSNINKIQNKIDALRDRLKPEQQRTFTSKIKDFQDRNPNLDYSNNSTTTNAINYFIGVYNDLIKSNSVKRTNLETNSRSSYSSSSNSTNDLAEEYYSKAYDYENKNQLDLARTWYILATHENSSHLNSYLGVVRVILDGEKKIINEMNTLRNSEEDNKRYAELDKNRKDLYKDALPYLEKAKKLKPNDQSIQKTLTAIKASLGYNVDGTVKEKKDEKIIARPHELREGYRTTKIYEYDFNKKDNQFELTNELDVNSKLFFGKDYYAFKRGSEPWKINDWTFSGYDEKNEIYIFYDNYGNTVIFDKELNSISWYFDREGNTFNKRIIYTSLKKDSTIIPGK